jgi:phosphatidate cytidylyltransferase
MADADAPAGRQDHRALRDLTARAISAVVMVALLVAALYLGGAVWLAFVALVALGAYGEWAMLSLRLARSPLARLLWLALGVGYIGLAARTLVDLQRQPNQYGEADLRYVVAVLASVIAVDVGAYLAGRVIGGPKIAPSISPGKTWAGLAGAMVCATLVTIQFGARDWRFFAAGPAIAVIAQAGDFFESWMKRRAGVKDSGRLIPGHGGLLDRVDGLLAVCFVLGIIRILAARG